MTVRELDNEIRILKGEPPLPATVADNNVVVEEIGPRVEVQQPINNNFFDSSAFFVHY